MRRNITTDNHLTMLCFVNGGSTSYAFSLEIDTTKVVDDLKMIIKADQSPTFHNITANNLTLWRVSIPIIFRPTSTSQFVLVHIESNT